MTEQEKNDEFIFAGIKERVAAYWLTTAITINVTTYAPVTGYSRYDVIFQSGLTKMCSEIKIRKRPSTDYIDWIVEFEKFFNYYLDEELTPIKRDEHNGIGSYYMVFFLDKVVLWSIDDLAPYKRFKLNNLRATSVLNNKEKRQKMITHFQVKESCQIIDYQINHEMLDLTAKRKFRHLFGRDYISLKQ